MNSTAHVREVKARLRTYDPRDPTALAWLVPCLRRLLGSHGAGAYGISDEGGRVRFSYGYFESLLGARTFDHCNRYFDVHGWSAAFNPLRPEAAQRNRLVVSAAPSDIARGVRGPRGMPASAVAGIRMGIEGYYRPIDWDRPTARLLVCDGPVFVAYVGVTALRGFAAVQLGTFRRLVPAIRTRLLLEHRLVESKFAVAGLDAALEAIPSAAFVVSAQRIRRANAIGRRWLDEDRRGVAAVLLRLTGPDPHLFDVTELAGTAPREYLAVRRFALVDHRAVVPTAARRWKLTPRETDVARWLAQGASNLRIAAELDCAEGTVEIHVSHILSKAGVTGRAALVAAIWSGA